MEAIRAAMAKCGRRVTPSQAIRLALRAVEINEGRFAELLDAMNREDGRTNRPVGKRTGAGVTSKK